MLINLVILICCYLHHAGRDWKASYSDRYLRICSLAEIIGWTLQLIWCLLADSDDYLVPVIVPSVGSSYNQSPVLSSFCWGSEEWKTEDKQSSQHDSLFWRIDTQSAAYYNWTRNASETLSCYLSLMITSWSSSSPVSVAVRCHVTRRPL